MNLQELAKNSSLRKYAIIAVVLALFIFITGRTSGYLIAQENYNTQLANLTASYELLNGSYSGCLQDALSKSSQISLLESDKAKLAGDLSSSNSNLANCNSDLSSAKSSASAKDSQISDITQQKNALSSDYSVLASNSAKALCCIKKIFDPALAAYYIENNTIVCTSDGSKTTFSC